MAMVNDPWDLFEYVLKNANSWEEIQSYVKGIIVDTMGSLPAAEEGQLVHHDKRFYLTSANRRIISRASDVLITPITVANTTVETLLWTGTVDADTLAVGKVYRTTSSGKFSTANASDSLKIRVKLNDVTLVEIDSVLGNVTDKPGSVKSCLTVKTIGATGTVSSFFDLQLDEKIYRADISSTVIDTTTGSDIKVTAQWDAADAANTMTIDQGFLEGLG